MLALSWIAAAHGDTGLVGALFDGIKPAVVAIIVAAVWRMGRRTLKGPAAVAMAGAAFLALFALNLPFPLVIGAAAVVGGVAARTGRHWFAHPHPVADGDAMEDAAEPAPKPGRLLVLATLFVLLWAVPVGRCCWPSEPIPGAASRRCSPRRPSSPSAAPMPCCPTSPGRRWSPMAGSTRARWSTGWPWPRRRRGR
nr:chromate transporter [Azospirillum sp. INR13]